MTNFSKCVTNQFWYVSPKHYLKSFVNSFHQPYLTYFSNWSFRATYLLLRLGKVKSCQGWNPKHKQQLSVTAVTSQVSPYLGSATVPAFPCSASFPHQLQQLPSGNHWQQNCEAAGHEDFKPFENPVILKQMSNQPRGELAPDSEETQPHAFNNSLHI